MAPQSFGAPGKPQAEVDGDKTGKIENTGLLRFNLTLPAASAIEPIAISLSSTKPDFADYALTFEVRFFDGTTTLFPTIVPDNDASDAAASAFVDEASVKSDAAELFEFNQRARILFRSRMATGNPPPLPADVGIAFWLVQSSAALISKSRVVIDPDTLDAVDFLRKRLAAGDSLGGRFFSGASVTRDQAAEVLGKVELRNRTVRAPLITELDNAILQKSKRADACSRLGSVREIFRAEQEDESLRYDGWLFQHLLVISDSMKCLHATYMSGQVPEDATDASMLDLQLFGNNLAEYATSAEPSDTRNAELIRRIKVAIDLASAAKIDLPESISGFSVPAPPTS